LGVGIRDRDRVDEFNSQPNVYVSFKSAFCVRKEQVILDIKEHALLDIKDDVLLEKSTITSGHKRTGISGHKRTSTSVQK
jgi:hypothetical protein